MGNASSESSIEIRRSSCKPSRTPNRTVTLSLFEPGPANERFSLESFLQIKQQCNILKSWTSLSFRSVEGIVQVHFGRNMCRRPRKKNICIASTQTRYFFFPSNTSSGNKQEGEHFVEFFYFKSIGFFLFSKMW